MRRILAAAVLLLAACGDNAPSVLYNVTLSPAAATVTAGKTFQLGALSKGKVTWSVPAGGGTVDANGLYTAPATPGPYRVPATSGDAASKSGSATVTVVAPAATPVITVNRLVTIGKSATALVPDQSGVTF